MPPQEAYTLTLTISDPLAEAIRSVEAAVEDYRRDPSPENKAKCGREFDAARALINDESSYQVEA